MPLPITALYAGLAALIVIALALRIPPMRYKKKVGLGDGGDADLLRAMRQHGNAVETVLLALILLGLAEGLGTTPWLLHILGGALLLGRVLHAAGLQRSSGASVPRAVGMVTTIAMMTTTALLLVVKAVDLI